MARTRTPLPKGKDAEEELKRIRRNERRAERRARKAAAERGEPYDEQSAKPAPADSKWDVEPAMFDGIPDAAKLKGMFAEAFADLGGVAGLVTWGRRYPKEFYAIWARVCLPRTLSDGDSGAGAGIEDVIAQLDKAR